MREMEKTHIVKPEEEKIAGEHPNIFEYARKGKFRLLR